jgi:hypothetical protein
VRQRSAIANRSSVTRGAASRAGAPGNSRLRARNAFAVASPAARIVSSNVIGMNARRRVVGLPPTFSGQSKTAA